MRPEDIQDIADRHHVLTREEFHEFLTEEEKAFFVELNEKLGPLAFEWGLRMDS